MNLDVLESLPLPTLVRLVRDAYAALEEIVDDGSDARNVAGRTLARAAAMVKEGG